MTPQVQTLLYFAPVPWDSYPQRPHYFVRHSLKRAGTRVVWVDPYPIRLPTSGDLRRVVGGARIALPRPANLTVISLRTLPIEPVPVARWLNCRWLCRTLSRRVAPLLRDRVTRIGIGRPSSLALAALGLFKPVASFYDAMDDFPQFYSGVSRASVSAREREIARAVDVVVTSSSALWAKFSDLGPRRVMVHNAFEMSALPALPIPRNGRHVFGYVGCIGSWFDWSITVRLARSFPDVPVHIVGPCYSNPPRDLPSNVTLFPACSLGQSVEHFRTFSVGLIPFKRIPLTDGVDPVKYYGYRGMGLPVLSTSFGEMGRRGVDAGAYLIEQGAGLQSAAASALDARFDAAVTDAFRREHTWERRFDDDRTFDRVLSCV
jgi:hypothetical protein